MKKKQILAIIGSTRKNSSNKAIIDFIKDLFHEDFNFEIFDELALLSHFNPDLDNGNVPPTVTSFRKKLKTQTAL